MNMNDTFVCLKTLSDIQNQGLTFYIDAYQRGYRWTEIEVRDLLEDIHEFSKSGYAANPSVSKFYCLQPIIITKQDEKKYKVIDGQQRLTTLYLIFIYFINSNIVRNNKKPFEIQYNNKTILEKCLSDIYQKGFTKSEELNQIASYENDIDCYFIINAYKEICNYFNKLDSNSYTADDPDEMKKVFNNYMKLIWYEVLNCDVSKETNIFTRINMGKIPLSNAELIKALLLKGENDSMSTMQTDIALKWNDIESQFANDNFWSFLVNNTSEYTTRIDFLFDVMAYEINEYQLKDAHIKYQNEEDYYIDKESNIKYFSFYVINNYIKYLKKHPVNDSKDSIEIIWENAMELFRMFLDWYRNRRWYHMIGYIIEISKTKYIERIYSLSRIYRTGKGTAGSGKGHKTIFEEELRKIISSTIKKNTIIKKKDELKDYVTDLEYDKNKEEIKKILFLYNICSLELLENKTDARFPFEKYKSKEIMWDIEHINAVADERPNDDKDTPSNECLAWLKNAKYVSDNLLTKSGRNVKNLIPAIISEKLYLPKNGDSDFIEVYEAIVNDFNKINPSDNNGIGNLTLLDSNTNRSYKNDIFPLKRQEILERCYQEKFIPLCTKNIFLKAFPDSDNLIKWTQEDYDNYVENIIDVITKYLRLEEN